MSLAIDPANLPAIPLWVRQWIYLLYLLALLAANSVDAFYADADPWWLAGTLRVLNVVGIFISAVALVNARPTPAEHARDVRAAEVEAAVQEYRPVGELGLPDNLHTSPVTRREDDPRTT